MIERFENFSLAISALDYYLHKITRTVMEEYGLSGPHAIYFFILNRNKEGMTSAELSEAAFRNKADVSRAIKLFEKNGLVVKKSGTANSYRAKIFLTEKGLDAAEKLRDRSKSIIALAGEGLTNASRANLYDSLMLIASNMKKITERDDELI